MDTNTKVVFLYCIRYESCGKTVTTFANFHINTTMSIHNPDVVWRLQIYEHNHNIAQAT